MSLNVFIKYYLIASIVALVADPDQGAGSYIGVTDDTFSVTFLTQTSCRSWKCKYLLSLIV